VLNGWRQAGSWWIGPGGARFPVIAGGSDAEPTPTVVVDPPADAAPAETPEQRIARLEADNARLSGQVEILSTRPASAAAVAAAPANPETGEAILTAFANGQLAYDAALARVDTLYNGGKLTDGARVQLVAELAAERRQREREVQGARANQEARVKGRMRELMAKYPDLRVAGSPLILDVSAEIDRLVADLGYDADDLRTQVVAIERVTSAPAASSAHDFSRRRIPTSAAPGTTGAPEPTPARTEKPRGQQLYERLNAESQQFYREYHRGDLDAIYRALNFADEAMLARAGRFAR
jgi:hypothetical protein